MPKFQVTGPNGRVLELDGPTPPTEQELDQIFSSLDAPGADPSLWDRTKDMAGAIGGRSLDVLGRVTGTLNRLGVGAAHAVDETIDTLQGEQSVGQGLGDFAGKIKDTFTPVGEGLSGKLQNIGKWKDNTDFNQVLENQGVEEYLKSKLGDKAGDWATAGAGFVGDVLLDPLRIGAVNKLVGKGIGAAGDTVGAGVKLVTPQKIQSAVKQAFVPDYADMAKFKGPNSEINLADQIRLHESRLRHAGEEAADFSHKTFSTGKTSWLGQDVALPMDKKVAFSHAIDQGRAVPEGMAKQETIWRDTMDQIWREKQEMGSTQKLFDAQGQRFWDGPRDIVSKEQNYVPRFTKSGKPDPEAVVGGIFRTKTRTDKVRDGYESLEEAVRHASAPEDAQVILETAMTMHGRAKRTHEFLNVLKQEFGQTAPSPGMRKLDRKAFAVSDLLWGGNEGLGAKYFPEEMADYLERSVKLWEKPSELDNLWKTTTKIWKGAATSVNIPHHFTNMLGNVMNMYTRGGMDAGDIGKYMTRAYHALGNGGADMWRVAGLNADELKRLAAEYEIIGTSGPLRELTEAGTADKVLNNRVLQGMRKFGTARVEEPARLALWMHAIEKKGMTPAQAAIHVKDTLLDYAELTPFERTVRDYGIPFFTWARKNPVVQLEGLKMDPKKFANIGDFENVMWNANADQVDGMIVPPEQIERGMIPGPLAGENGALVMNRFAAPQKDLNKLVDPIGMLMEGLHPALKAPIELFTNVRGSGGPVETPSGFATPGAFASTVSALTPDQIEQRIPEALQGYANVVNVGGRPRQRDYASWLESFVPTGMYGSAVKSYSDDPMNVQPENVGASMLMRVLGLTPKAISPMDQKYALDDLKAEHRRKMSKIVMER